MDAVLHLQAQLESGDAPTATTVRKAAGDVMVALTSDPSQCESILPVLVRILGRDWVVDVGEETMSALQLVVSLGCVPVVEALLGHSTSVQWIPDDTTIRMLPLAIAIGQQDKDMCRLLLGERASPFLLGTRDDLCSCPLVTAMLGGSHELVDLVVEYLRAPFPPSADVTAVPLDDPTPLCGVWETLQARTATLGVDDPLVSNGYGTLLQLILTYRGMAMVTLLEDVLSHFHRPNFLLRDRTLLQTAVIEGNIDAALLLVTHNAEMHSVPEGAFPLSPFVLSCCLGRLEMVELFVANGGSPVKDPHARSVEVVFRALQHTTGPITPPLPPQRAWQGKEELQEELAKLNAEVERLKSERNEEIRQHLESLGLPRP